MKIKSGIVFLSNFFTCTWLKMIFFTKSIRTNFTDFSEIFVYLNVITNILKLFKFCKSKEARGSESGYINISLILVYFY